VGDWSLVTVRLLRGAVAEAMAGDGRRVTGDGPDRVTGEEGRVLAAASILSQPAEKRLAHCLGRGEGQLK
jgi:hypothetical protein